MNLCLLHSVGKWIGLVIAFGMTIFGGTNNQMTINNDSINKNTYVTSSTIKYETKYQYDDKLPSNFKKVVSKGIDGIVYKTEDNEIVIQKMQPEIIVIGTGSLATYKGKLTGYGPDCVGCSKLGNVSCRLEDGTKHSLFNSIYYEDDQFGKVRIISADHRAFPCGTIIQISNSKMDKTLAIVLDTGGGMRKAYSEGWILIDLAFQSESLVHSVTNKNTTFEVKRWGW